MLTEEQYNSFKGMLYSDDIEIYELAKMVFESDDIFKQEFLNKFKISRREYEYLGIVDIFLSKKQVINGFRIVSFPSYTDYNAHVNRRIF